MRILVVTVVHVPLDARIFHRQIRSMLDAGWDVAYAAPWGAYRQQPPDGPAAIDLPRAAGRRRLAAVHRARRLILRARRRADLVVVHDPDLLLAVAGWTGATPVVWDVHEDTAAALDDRPWIPGWVRGPVRASVRAAEGWAEKRMRLLLAEPGYRERFAHDHPVVPNYPWLPAEVSPPGGERVVYVGRVSRRRGAREMLALADRLGPHVRLEVVGPADPDVAPDLEAASADGRIRWHGYLPNDEALALVDGALAGISLLHDEPNYRSSTPTKILEYMARGVPVVTTPLPEAARIVREHHAGIVVPFDDVEAAAAAVQTLRDDEDLRLRAGASGRAAVRDRYSWDEAAKDFLSALAGWAGS
jgi:glycosyltransferase involved in cell wall biosynthesis